MSDPLKILFVDDEPDLAPLIRQKFRSLVKEGALALVFAGDGVEALECLADDPAIEIVVTDINMPRMDGLTLLGKLRENGRRAKAVVVTAYGDMENIRTAMNRGAFDFLTKPIDMEDLQITLDQAREAVARDREADRVRDLFGRYLSDDVAHAILTDPAAFERGGETREVSVLMSDLSGFSQISETIPPERVVDLLNVYLGAMTDVVDEFGGTIDEFIGDAVLVIFGAPLAQPDHAERAVACAVAMQRRMEDVNAEMEARGLPRLQMTAAVNTGEVVVGTIGSEKRAKYAVVGSPVNMTGRIQTLAAPGEVLITEATRAAVGEAVAVADSREEAFKGLDDPVTIHSVLRVDRPGASGLSLDGGQAPLAPLAEPIAVRLAVLDGKRVHTDETDGRLLRLAPLEGELVTDAPVGAHTDVRLTISGLAQSLFGKAVGATEDGVRVRFTTVPDEAAAFFAERLGAQPGPDGQPA